MLQLQQGDEQVTLQLPSFPYNLPGCLRIHFRGFNPALFNEQCAAARASKWNRFPNVCILWIYAPPRMQAWQMSPV